MANFTAFYDACVLYPAPLRDFLLSLAQTELFRARWSSAVQDEWMENLLRDRADLKREQLMRTRELMDSSVPDGLVTDYEPLIESLTLPDPNDRHVLAAAIRCQAGVIVTINTKDFPAEILARYGIEAQHPDIFISHLMDLDRDAVAWAAREQRNRLRNPPKSVEEFLDALLRQGLTQTTTQLEEMIDLL